MEKEECTISLSFCSFFSCFTLSCVRFICCVIRSIQSKSRKTFALRATYSITICRGSKGIDKPIGHRCSIRCVPLGVLRRRLSVVRPCRVRRCCVTQAPDRTGRLFMPTRPHRLIVALLSPPSTIAASVASRRLTYFFFFFSSSCVGSDKWIVYFVTPHGLIIVLVHSLRGNHRLYLPFCFHG